MKKIFNKKLLFVLLLSFLLGIGYFLLNPNKSNTATPTYITQSITKDTVNQTITGSGNLQSGKTYNLNYKLAVDIIDTKVKAGDLVKKDDILLKVDDKDLKTKYNASLIAVKQAESSLNSLKVNSNINISQINLNTALDKLNNSKYQYKVDNENLTNSTLCSDSIGVVTSVKYSVGDTVQPNIAAITVVNQSENVMSINISQADYNKLGVGDSASINFVGSTTSNYSGYIISKDLTPNTVSPTAGSTGTTTITYPIKLKVNNPDGNLQIGMTGTATFTSVTPNIVLNGIYEASKIYTYAFKSSAKVTSVMVKVGDSVINGTKMMKIEDSDLKQKLTLSNQSIISAQNSYDQALNAMKTDQTYINIEAAEQKLEAAKLQLTADKESYDNAIAKSPFDGIVTEVKYNVGDNVNPNLNLLSIIDTNELLLNMQVGEIDVNKIKIGQLAELNFDAIGDKKYIAKVSSIDLVSTTVQNVVGYNVKLKLTKYDEDLRLGMSGTANILVNSKEGVIAVSNSAVKSSGSQKYVQILENNAPKNINITLGLVGDTKTEVLTGLKEGDSVITQTITTSVISTTGAPSLFNLGGTGQQPRRN